MVWIGIGYGFDCNWFGQKMQVYRIIYGLNLDLDCNWIGIANDMNWIGLDLIKLGNALE
jgi:hypothetical protein